MMQKNELVKVKIEDIGVGGEGIGKVDGYTLFIKDTIIGDVVEAKVMKAKKNYGYARLMNVLTPSEDRVEKVVCPMARKCGAVKSASDNRGNVKWSRSRNRMSLSSGSFETPSTVNPRELRRARLSRKSQASVVQPGVIAAG